jgi:hypothetical protein
MPEQIIQYYLAINIHISTMMYLAKRRTFILKFKETISVSQMREILFVYTQLVSLEYNVTNNLYGALEAMFTSIYRIYA